VTMTPAGQLNPGAVLSPGDLGHSPGLRAKIFAIFYVDPSEFFI